MHIGEFLKLKSRSHVGLNLQERERLEELFLDLPLRRPGQADDKRESTVTTGEHIDDESRFPIFQRVEHNGRRLCQHTTAKILKKVESGKWKAES